MRKLILLVSIGFSLVIMLSACGTTATVNDVTSESISIVESEKAELNSEDIYNKAFNFFTEGKVAKSRHSLITNAVYYVGASEEDDCLQFIYISDDRTQGVLINLDRDGNLDITVNIKSANEGVVGTCKMNASDYTYGYEFSDFAYDFKQHDWDYEKFKVRANAYIRDTLLYTDRILQDYLEFGLQELGLTSWKSPGILSADQITADEIAGMWDYKSSNSKEYSSRIYLTEDKLYWRGYEEHYADAITASVMIESEDFLLSNGMTMSVYDPWTGEILITDEYVGNDKKTHEEFRRYIYRDESGNLCMRVESVYLGLSNSEDGKIYVKMDDEVPVNITPKKYDPTASGTEDSITKETTEDQPDTQNEHGNNATAKESSYQSILDTYTAEMKREVGKLVREYDSESSGIRNIETLAEICNEKVGKLAEICNDGIGDMAELMYTQGDTYDTYEYWAGKLQDNYTEIAQEIQDAYLESTMN